MKSAGLSYSGPDSDLFTRRSEPTEMKVMGEVDVRAGPEL